MSKSKRHPQYYLLPILSTFIVFVGIALQVETNHTFTATQIFVVLIIYYTSNLSYGLVKKQLDLKKIVEYGLITIFIGYIAFTYLI